MAQDDFNESPLPIGPRSKEKRQNSNLLPNFFRSDANKKFIGGTVDVATQPGTLKKISSYIGHRDVKNYKPDEDNYIEETSTPRQYYQLETAFVNQDPITQDVNWFGDYIDYINSLKYFGANVANHSKLNRQESYTWDPHIDWDKFTNYREYYWLPQGPDPVTVYGQLENITSTFTVTTRFDDDNIVYIFTPDGLTANPRLTLYRGITYTFIIDAPSTKFSIKTQNESGDSYFYEIGVSAKNVEKGTLTFTVPYEAPDLLYYVDNTVRENLGIIDETVGLIDIRDIKEAASLNVEQEIIGKVNFTSSDGIEFVNGLVVQFSGKITPEKYATGQWYVEGVGKRIVLINTKELESPATFIKDKAVPFDDQPFDSLPWESAENYPYYKDYLVINRSSRDRNNWARINRWFHKSVVEISAKANGAIAQFDQTARALRPIIEFEPDLKLFNHGYFAKADIDLVDTVTTDVFSIIEGSTGYIVDGQELLPGYRILFLADNDILVKGKIFEVKQITNIYENSNQDIVVISTAAENNTITIPETNTIKPGMTVKFSGTLIGGLSSSVTYYVIRDNFTLTTFSVSLTANGSPVELTDSTDLTMRVSVVGSGVRRRKQQLTLQEVPDTTPTEGEIVYITKGYNYRGTSFYYLNGVWNQAQKKSSINQAPLFDLFDENYISYSDTTVYPYNNFKGTKLFNYKVGTGKNDPELGFPITYRAIGNVGDIQFEFSLEKDSWQYTLNKNLVSLNSYEGFLRRYTINESFEYLNGWIETDRKSEQNVVRVLKVESTTNSIPVDVYDDAQLLYALEQANQLLSSNQLYISIQDNSGRDLLDTDYWLPFDYKVSYRGDWGGIGSTYLQRDIVRYDNFYYQALEDIVGNSSQLLPTNTNYWKLLFQGYRYKGEFNLIDNYVVDDIITYKGYTYIAIRDNFDHYFPTDITYWKVLIKGESRFRGEYNVVTGKFKGPYSSQQQYLTNDVVKFGQSFYLALRNNITTSITDTNTWKFIDNSNTSNFDNVKTELIYSNKDIVTYGMFLYVSNTDNNTANPTDINFWTQLSSGTVFPTYYNNQTLYREGAIVVPDMRTKVDYRIRVYVNDKKRNDLSLGIREGIAYINFENPLSAGDTVVYKVRSISNKNLKGYYEIPLNWQNNPFNQTVDTFTFGEVIDHVRTIVENSSNFEGIYPGNGNLSNLGDITNLGRKFMQHSGPMSLSSFLMIDKNINIIRSLQWSSREYTQFKKDMIYRLSSKGFDGTAREIADQVLLSYTQSKYAEKTPFYFSDMVPLGAASVREYTVEDPRFPVFVIDSIFNPKSQTKRSILVYVNEDQLLYGKDYEFHADDAFIEILSTLSIGDKILIKDYNNTDGCYVPLTPSKLGLYPLYEPMIYIDDTYRELIQNLDGTTTPVKSAIKVIQGHDGSIFKAYNDYRDDVILEIEKRIFNGVRVDYDPNIFDIYDVLTGYYRRTEFTKNEINDVLITEFLKWNSIPSFDFNSTSYTVPGEDSPRYQWVDGDPFTYNYNKSTAPNGKEFLLGYWRGIYKYFFDTDRPHTHPWEMQGFTIKPIWWDDVYGVAPYTSENKIMWDSIEKGIINDPKGRKINLKFARPGLGGYLPVDDSGNLLSPFESGLVSNFSKVQSRGRYTFGDYAPVETAWRRSSEYPFAVMILMSVLRGSEFIGKMWDRFTIKRNIAGQMYSTVTKKKLNTADLIFSNEPKADGTRTITNGLSNFIDEYVFFYTNIDYNYYKSLLRGLTSKLRYRLGGFSSKDKIKVLLDSRTPNSTGTIFLPNENYKIFYNKSAPVETVNYSGVIIEKKTDGYSIKGYDYGKNVFEIFPPRISATDPVINVGGISESYVDWAPNQFYTVGQLVKIDSHYYRVLIAHTSGESETVDIAAKKFQRLASLPMTGGREAYLRSKFINVPIKVPYGTVFEDPQSVVDFLFGYQARLEDWGFQFDDFSADLNVPLNWNTSVKEFLFWTLQNWVTGSVITLSPAANNLKFTPKITASVDNLNNEFYGHSIFKADGAPLLFDLTNIYRENNGFTIKPTIKTADGIYHLETSLVYQEHVILFDNQSVFGDILYDMIPGYRQGRLKLIGFKTTNWDGSYYSPGFMYDNANVLSWEPNTDYDIGDVVLYKNYYYTALERVYGTSEFEYSKWTKLSSRPEAKLEPNLDYRIEQFRDFYSLESSNFDANQVNLSRHLTGYQERQYLQDIIVDDVSQYKFYQGYIKEKGTLNSVTKLFDALRASGQSTVDLKEEWAFKVGDFGASDAYNEIEFVLDESKFLHNPQDVVLSVAPQDFKDLSIYNITINDVVKKSINYDANPFVTKALDFTQKNYGVFKYRVAGYVNPNHIDLIIYDEPSLINYDYTLLKNRDKIWIGNTPNGDWNVMVYYDTRAFVTSWERQGNILNLYLSSIPNLEIGDIVVVRNINAVQGLYKVLSIFSNFIQVYTNDTFILNTTMSDSTHGILFKFESVRYKNPSLIEVSRYNSLDIAGEKVWIDRDSNDRWKVLENSKVFTANMISSPLFLKREGAFTGYEVKLSSDKKFLFVSSLGYLGGTVIIYSRPTTNYPWIFKQTIVMPTDFSSVSGTENFGYSIDISSDSRVLVISAPDTSGIKSQFKGNYIPGTVYLLNDVVIYNDQLWIKVVADIDGGDSNSVQDFLVDGGLSDSIATNIIDGGNSISDQLDTDAWNLLSQVYEVAIGKQQSGLTKQGAVFVYFYNISKGLYERDTFVVTTVQGTLISREQIICSYKPLSNERFGTKVKLSKIDRDYWLYVSCEGNDQSGAIQVFKRNSLGVWTYNTDQQYLNFDNIEGGLFPSPNVPSVGDLYGYDLAVYGNIVVTSAPYLNGGAAYVFEKIGTTFTLLQVIDSYTIQDNIMNTLGSKSNINEDDNFGYSLSMKGNDLFISAPNNDSDGPNLGVIYKFEFNISTNQPFTLTQMIYPPIKIQNERFGVKIDTNSDQTILVASSRGGSVTLDTTFNVHVDRLVFTSDSTRNYILDPNSDLSDYPTSFDLGATVFYDQTPYTGSAYVYNSFDNKFVYADNLVPTDELATADNFGIGLSISDDCIVAGAPQHHIDGLAMGSIYSFDYTSPSWAIIAAESNVVDVDKFKKAFVYNTKTNKLIENLDFIDPLKGHIPGPAAQEIKYECMRDPASYEFLNSSIVQLDQSEIWTDDHVGEVWWDLSSVKWMWYEQGDSTFRSTHWGNVFPGSSIDIYEWTETTLLPSEWTELSQSPDGIKQNVTGTPAYVGDLTYSTKQKYDPETGYLKKYYYYWVKNKLTIPNMPFRSMSTYDVSQMIFDPSISGYKFIAITGKDNFSLFNIKPDVYHRDINLNLQFYKIDNTDLIVHREYALITENDPYATIPTVVETKWIDSLCGSNVLGNRVPDPRLSRYQRYGSSNEPRQTWFSNRFEALKQYFEYVNSILAKKQITDEINFVNLLRADNPPTLNSGDIDQVVDILDDLRFIGTSKLVTAKLTPRIKDGQLIGVDIDNPGYGYKVAPKIKILGTGTGAIVKTTLDSNGSIVNVEVIKRGKEYDSSSTKLYIRNYTVLVKSDVEALGGWTLHDWFSNTGNVGTYYWRRVKTQGWDVTRYWYYTDWYETGFNVDSSVKYQVERTTNLSGLQSSIGDLVRVSNVNGNWLLLQKKSDIQDPDYTLAYRVVGKQNGTIQFSDKLYNLNKDLGYDTIYSYDTGLYDQGPSIELRIILEAIRDNVLVDTLRVEYINTFFNSVNYTLNEHMFVDWVFKTSFLKINHNAGTLSQRPTYQSDMLPSYQKYIEEVKPYKSKIREMLDSYINIDLAQQVTTDFDLFSYYDQSIGKILTPTVNTTLVNTYPWKNWLDNYKYGVAEIEVYDQGDGYRSAPDVIITGDGTGAKATAYIARGKVIRVIVDNPGKGYTYAPTIFLSGGNDKTNPTAKAVARLGNNLVRTATIGMKYDRVSSSYLIDDFYHTDTFSGDGKVKKFRLTFAPDPKKVNLYILVNNVEIYGSLYDISIVQNVHDTYSALEGYIVFKTAPVSGTNNITINYKKNIQIFTAADRINYGYTPSAGQFGKELNLLMNGVDYGGVQLTSIEFDVGSGWDVIPWDTISWDNVITSNDDYVVVSDGTTVSFTLPYVPAVNELINIYVNSVRIDDPYYSSYDGSTRQPNGLTSPPSDAISMNTFVGDGVNNVITLPHSYSIDSLITFRKSTSDGAILPSDTSLIDALVDGGDLTYATARGIKPEEIIIDGDQLISSDTSYGPEELVQGQVVDTLEISVYHSPSSGGPNVIVHNFVADGINSSFSLPPSLMPQTREGSLVTVGSDAVDIAIDYKNNKITLLLFDLTTGQFHPYAPEAGSQIAITSVDTSGYDILDQVVFFGDGSTTEFLTSARYSHGNVTPLAIVNGEYLGHEVISEGTAQGGDSTSIILSASDISSSTDYSSSYAYGDAPGAFISIIDGAGAEQFALIEYFDPVTKVAIVIKESFSWIGAGGCDDTSFYVESTSTIPPGTPIVISKSALGASFGGIDSTIVYYVVSDNFTSTSFSISTTIDGPVVALQPGMGVMLIKEAGWDSYSFNEIAPTLDVSTRYIIQVQPNSKRNSISIKESTLAEYGAQGNVIVEFEKAPGIGDRIVLMIFSGTVQKFSRVYANTIPIVPGQYEYALDRTPANEGPLSAKVFVLVGSLDTVTGKISNEFIQAPAYKYFTYDGTNALNIQDVRFLPNTLIADDITVYINGSEIVPVRDYSLDSTQEIITLVHGVANLGDEIIVEISKLADYKIMMVPGPDSTLVATLVFNKANYQIQNQIFIIVNTFTNHDIVKLKRKSYGFKFTTGYDVLPFEFSQYDLTSTVVNSSGIFDLPRTVSSKASCMVSLNRRLLIPNIDYVILDNLRQVKVLLPDILSSSGYIEILTVNDQTVRPSFGFKIFKDMLNKTIYERIDSSSSTYLKQDFTYLDTQFVVRDQGKLQVPTLSKNLPGVVEIEGERIEYFKINNDSVSQIRRATLGTGARNYYPAGTEVKDIGQDQIVPYVDKEQKRTAFGDGYTTQFYLDFAPKNSSLKRWFNNLGYNYRGVYDYTAYYEIADVVAYKKRVLVDSTVAVTRFSSDKNIITCTDTSNLTIGSEVTFVSSSGNLNLGEIVEGRVYYVHAIKSATTFTITSELGGLGLSVTLVDATFSNLQLRIFDYKGSYYSARSPSIIVTGSTTITNLISCSSTATLVVGTEIVFSKSFGNLTAGTSYFVRTIFSETTFTVSEVLGGPVLDLATENQKVIINTIPVLRIENKSDLGFWEEYSQIIDDSWYRLNALTHKSTKTYYLGDIVYSQGRYYQAIQNVPISIIITNTNYWVPYTFHALDSNWYREATDIIFAGNFIVGTQYTIIDLGYQMNWHEVGVPEGITPFKGLTFTATATGPSATTVSTVLGSAITAGIPKSYGQCDEIEVFVGGRRLIKTSHINHDYNASIDSYQNVGDNLKQAEFSVDGITNTVRLTVPPAAGELVVIVYKNGRIWKMRDENVPLVFSKSEIAQFLTARQAILPK